MHTLEYVYARVGEWMFLNPHAQSTVTCQTFLPIHPPRGLSWLGLPIWPWLAYRYGHDVCRFRSWFLVDPAQYAYTHSHTLTLTHGCMALWLCFRIRAVDCRAGLASLSLSLSLPYAPPGPSFLVP